MDMQKSRPLTDRLLSETVSYVGVVWPRFGIPEYDFQYGVAEMEVVHRLSQASIMDIFLENK